MRVWFKERFTINKIRKKASNIRKAKFYYVLLSFTEFYQVFQVLLLFLLLPLMESGTLLEIFTSVLVWQCYLITWDAFLVFETECVGVIKLLSVIGSVKLTYCDSKIHEMHFE